MPASSLPPPPRFTRGFTGRQVLAWGIMTIILTALCTVFLLRFFLFPQPFTPVHLTDREQQHLEHKLGVLQHQPAETREQDASLGKRGQTDGNKESLVPEPYVENPEDRTVSFTERELNGLLAHNTNLAKRLAIDLSEDMISLKLLLPIDPDFPVMGGKTLRVRAGAELAYSGGRPIVRLRGISVMGVPLPNAWLGGIKNIDLVSEFGQSDGFWKSFADGIEEIQVSDGFLRVSLRP